MVRLQMRLAKKFFCNENAVNPSILLSQPSFKSCESVQNKHVQIENDSAVDRERNCKGVQKARERGRGVVPAIDLLNGHTVLLAST